MPGAPSSLGLRPSSVLPHKGEGGELRRLCENRIARKGEGTRRRFEALLQSERIMLWRRSASLIRARRPVRGRTLAPCPSSGERRRRTARATVPHMAAPRLFHPVPARVRRRERLEPSPGAREPRRPAARRAAARWPRAGSQGITAGNTDPPGGYRSMSRIPDFSTIALARPSPLQDEGKGEGEPWLTPEGIAVKPRYGAEDRDGIDFLDTYPGPAALSARPLPDDVRQPALDGAAVRRLLDGRGFERLLPPQPRGRAEGPLGRLRPRDPPRLRLATIRASRATSAWPASRSTRSTTCARCLPASRSTR